MKLNTILGWIGLSLLAFVAAFAVGRMTRPAPSEPPGQRPVSEPSLAAYEAPSVDSINPPQNDLDSMAEAEEEPITSLSEADAPEAEPTNEPAPAPATPPPAGPSPQEVAARRRAAENRLAVAARRAHAAQLPEEFRKYYAQELPEDAISEELEVRANVSGAQAEVMTISSPAFNATNEDFVLQQVRSDLTALGFKQINITDGKGFRASVKL